VDFQFGVLTGNFWGEDVKGVLD